MRFPTRLLAANLWVAFFTWLAFTGAVIVLTLGIHLFGNLTRSVWEGASQLPRWAVMFVGVALVRQFLPLFIAHGQTRRQFGFQAAITAALYVPFAAALMSAGYLVERVLYGLLDRQQVLDRPHLYTDPAQVPMVFLEYTVEFMAWITAGLVMGGGFYRWRAGGLLTIPIGVGLIALGLSAIGTQFQVPFSSFALGLDLEQGPLLAAGLGLVTFLIGLALAWSVIRDTPLRNQG
ncbi:hypothetical protein [Nonomuraea typhae]|uniref:hypothetical protein n=1 Tax=Nonomuraea typhae TaxID=2603600 RepID=UPI0012FAD132|nr:hypothetical protein [Nonomuraea typhae]